MSGLPKRVEPRRLAVTSGVVEGEVPVAAMARLAADLYPESVSNAVPVQVRLEFVEDDQRRVSIDGRVRAEVLLRCQRCLGPVAWTVDVAPRITAVVDDAAAAAVPRDREPVIVGEQGLDPAALAEEELILALPVVAYCDDQACRQRFENDDGGEPPADNPFAALRNLKRDR